MHIKNPMNIINLRFKWGPYNQGNRITGGRASKLHPTKSVQTLTIFMMISVFLVEIVLFCFNYAHFGA